jgi:hypothetical protein
MDPFYCVKIAENNNRVALRGSSVYGGKDTQFRLHPHKETQKLSTTAKP